MAGNSNPSTNRPREPVTSIIRLITALTLIAQGCSFQPSRPEISSQQTPIFLPPVEAPSATPQPTISPTETTETIEPVSAVVCEDNLTFINDLTIPDGSTVKPGSALDKRWEVRNSGSCNWDARYQLRLTAGDPLGANEQLALYPARAGTSLVIRIEFQAPMQPGNYRGAWLAHNPAGEEFGDPVFIDIIVTD